MHQGVGSGLEAPGALQPKDGMNPMKIFAFALIVAGALGLAYGGFSYTKDSHDVQLGPVEFSINEKQHVNIPLWAGVGAIVLGGVMLLAGGGKR